MLWQKRVWRCCMWGYKNIYMDCCAVNFFFYLKLVIYFKNNDCRKNPYNPCVKSKLVNRKWWKRYDLKVSQKNSFEVTKFTIYLSSINGNKLKFHRGKVHYYLRMNLEKSETGLLKVSMVKYLQKINRQIPEK